MVRHLLLRYLPEKNKILINFKSRCNLLSIYFDYIIESAHNEKAKDKEMDLESSRGGFEMRNLVPILLIAAVCFIFTACGA